MKILLFKMYKKLQVIVLLSCLIIPIVGYTQAGAKQATPPLTLYNVSYGSDSLQAMDVYLSPGRTLQSPLVILIHGGGWMAGDKRDADFMKDLLIRNGINVININYRLGNQTQIHYLEMMKDVGTVIKYIRGHAKKWKIRKNKFVLWGGSAGAHLALLYAYKFDKRNVISAVITLGAPTKLNDIGDFKEQDVYGLLPIVSGEPWKGDTSDITIKNVSPYYSKHFKPTFLVHGEKDDIVSINQAIKMKGLLQENKIPYLYFPLPNGLHGGQGSSAEDMKKLNAKILEWIRKYSR